MKTFFTLCAVIFLGVVIAIFVAGYISKSNRESREAYEIIIKNEMVAMTATITQATEEIERLKEENLSLTTQLSSASITASTTKVSTVTKITQPVIKPATLPVVTKKLITTSLVATHNTSSDCWIIVSGKAYSVSGYMAMHPGGRSVIASQCGKDATTAFSNKGGEGKHSENARTILGGLLVGALGQAL